VANPDALETPAMLLFRDVVDHNIRRVCELVDGGENLIAQVKTHKSEAVARRQIEQGIHGFKCATLKELEMVLRAGAGMAILSYPQAQKVKVERLTTWPHINFCTDGGLVGTHPRGFGSFPRVLGHCVRERQVMTLEEAIHKATAGAASSHGIDDRGRIEPGAYAGLVLFDPETVTDRSTTGEPHVRAAGIDRVWVNGHLIYHDGLESGQKYGRVLRRQPSP
jgi:N-acyl-D-aspartate/D-glutamate deacylase